MEMNETIRLVITALKTAGLACGITVVLLIALGAGTATLYFIFLAIGLVSLAAACLIHP